MQYSLVDLGRSLTALCAVSAYVALCIRAESPFVITWHDCLAMLFTLRALQRPIRGEAGDQSVPWLALVVLVEAWNYFGGALYLCQINGRATWEQVSPMLREHALCCGLYPVIACAALYARSGRPRVTFRGQNLAIGLLLLVVLLDSALVYSFMERCWRT